LRKGYSILFFLLNSAIAEETNFSNIFFDFQSGNDSSQKVIEERLEQDIAKFRSVEASRVVLPFGELESKESIWGVADPRVVNVDVVLKLKKRKRLTFNEFRGISDLVSSSLSEKNRVLQVNVKDEEGFRWSDESEESKSLFKAAEIEQEINSFLKDQSSNEILWSNISVSDKDFSCYLEGRYISSKRDLAETRKEVMDFLGDFCTSSKIRILPSNTNAQIEIKEKLYQWGERISFILVGFSFCGLIFRLRKKRLSLSKIQKEEENNEGAIVLTRIVERSPDEAAKWMVKALMSESSLEINTQNSKNNPESRIIDDSV
jgi:hypothetical protein